nr:MAK10-like protein [Tanacetum cinerariifolium]
MALIFGSKSKSIMTMSIPPQGEPSISRQAVSFVKKRQRILGTIRGPSYDNESWNDPRDFAKLVKAISLPQDVLSTSDRRLIELEKQVQRLMKAHLAPKSSVQVNKITSSCEACSGSHDTQYCMKNPKQAFVDYASSRTDEARSNTFKPQQNNLGDTHSLSWKIHPNLRVLFKFNPLYLFKKLKIGLLEETDHVFGLADRTKSYPVGIVKNVEVHIGRLKLLEDFYVIDMEIDPTTPLLVGRGFLATSGVMIDCRKAKIVVGEGVTRSVFRVKEFDIGGKETPYWTTFGKRESYGPRLSTDDIGSQPTFYARKDFLDHQLPREWEIARDVKLNPFKDIRVFRKMVEFLGTIPINLKGNM